MTRRQRLGSLGERLAAVHLEAKGYRLRERNFRVREGEIDIVAEVGDVLVFVEVRTRRGHTMGTAIESITDRKRQRLLAAAQAYGQQREGLPGQWRLDVIAVDLAADGRLLKVEHVENAVEGGDALSAEKPTPSSHSGPKFRL
ncbi:MAG: YraN family protein [Dehalococcoidia bacterium]